MGLLLLVLLILGRPQSRQHLAVDLPQAYRSGRLVWWQFLGGLGGASVVASQTVTVPLLGVALFTVALVAGMTGSSLLVDRIGLAPGGKRAITGPRVIGAVGTTVAVGLAVSGRLSEGNLAILALIAVVAAGVASSFQQAVNAQISVATRDPLVAAFVNFVAGLIALIDAGTISGKIAKDVIAEMFATGKDAKAIVETFQAHSKTMFRTIRPTLMLNEAATRANILRALGYVLSKEGFRVETASSGEEALLQARKLSPLVIFLDIMMPGINGLEVCERLRNDRTIPRAYIIMLSARGQQVDVEKGLATGADEYMVKPFSPRELRARIKAALRRSAGEAPDVYRFVTLRLRHHTLAHRP